MDLIDFLHRLTNKIKCTEQGLNPRPHHFNSHDISQYTTQPNHCTSILELILFIAQLDNYLNNKKKQFNIFILIACIIKKQRF